MIPIKDTLINNLNDIFDKLPGDIEIYYYAKHVLYFLYFAEVLTQNEFGKYDYYLRDVYSYLKSKGDIT